MMPGAKHIERGIHRETLKSRIWHEVCVIYLKSLTGSLPRAKGANMKDLSQMDHQTELQNPVVSENASVSLIAAAIEELRPGV